MKLDALQAEAEHAQWQGGYCAENQHSTNVDSTGFFENDHSTDLDSTKNRNRNRAVLYDGKGKCSYAVLGVSRSTPPRIQCARLYEYPP